MGFENNKLNSYGIENPYLSNQQKKVLEVIDTSIIKRALNLSKYCNTDLLYKALNIVKFKKEYEIKKFSFFTRLSNYNLTKIFIEKQLSIKQHLSKASLVWEIANMLELRENEMTLDKLVAGCEIMTLLYKMEQRDIVDTVETLAIKYLLEDRNKLHNSVLDLVLRRWA